MLSDFQGGNRDLAGAGHQAISSPLFHLKDEIALQIGGHCDRNSRSDIGETRAASDRNRKAEISLAFLSFSQYRLDPVQVTQMARYLDTVYVSGWQCSSTASSTNEPGPDLAGKLPHSIFLAARIVSVLPKLELTWHDNP